MSDPEARSFASLQRYRHALSATPVVLGYRSLRIDRLLLVDTSSPGASPAATPHGRMAPRTATALAAIGFQPLLFQCRTKRRRETV
jgi:hypothetical protein